MMQGLALERHELNDRKAQGAAMTVMARAFDPAYGEAWSLPQLAGMMAMQGSWLTLARLDAAVLGFALVRSLFEEAELLLLAVDPGWRSHGIGRALLQHCIMYARLEGIHAMHLEVRANNMAARLYENAGFCHVNTRRDYYRGNDGTLYDALSYRLDL